MIDWQITLSFQVEVQHHCIRHLDCEVNSLWHWELSCEQVSLGQMVPMVDDSWRVKFEQVRSDGFSRLRGWWVFTSIIAPILIHLLTVLCLPYVLACGIFPLFGYSLVVNSSVYRFAWLGSLLLGLWWYGTKWLYKWLLDLHNSIRDDRYLVGRQLHNFAERRRVGRLGKVPSTSIAGSCFCVSG
jgi:E3 ubiquitin-protein ligase MARCH6